MPDAAAAATPAAGDGPAFSKRWLALAILLLAAFMNLIDVTIVNVALPTLQTDLGATSSDLEWIVAAYVSAFAIGLLPFGRLGDIVGRRHVFAAGVIGFTACSALCGLAPGIGWLVVARALQGLSAAMMMPQTLAIVRVMFPPRESGFAYSLFGLNAGLAAVAGPLVGGLLISADIYGLGWRPIFLVNLPFGIAAAAACFAVVPAIPGHRQLKVDWVGLPIATATVFCLVFPLVEGRSFGWPAWMFVLMALAVPCAFAFVRWQRRQAAREGPQLIPYQLMTNRSFLLGTSMTMALFSALPSFFMAFAIFLQSGFGFTPFQSGYTTTPMPVGIFIASLVTGRLGGRWPHRRIALGAVGVLAGFFWLRSMIAGIGDSVDHWQLAPALVTVGLGMGTAIGAIFQTVLATVPPQDAGSGSGALQSFQQMGLALGVAIGGQIFFSTLARLGPPSHATFVAALSNALFYQFAALTMVLLLCALVRPRPQPSGVA